MVEKAQGQHAEVRVKKAPGGRERRSNPMWLTLLLLAAALLILPPSAGKVSPVLTDDGRPAENGIAEKIWLPVNGVQQGMILRSGDRTRPVLLFLNGGPGIPDYFLARDAGLERLFTVCYWDYHGTGLSYSPEIRSEDCTTEQFVQDALAVTDALRAVRAGSDLPDGPFLRDLHRPALRAGRAGKISRLHRHEPNRGSAPLRADRPAHDGAGRPAAGRPADGGAAGAV